MILEAWLLIFGSCSWQNQACGVSEIRPLWSGSLFACLQNNHSDSQIRWHCLTENLLTSLSWCLLLTKGAAWLLPWSCMARPHSHHRAWKCSAQLPAASLPLSTLQCYPPSIHSPFQNRTGSHQLLMKTNRKMLISSILIFSLQLSQYQDKRRTILSIKI